MVKKYKMKKAAAAAAAAKAAAQVNAAAGYDNNNNSSSNSSCSNSNGSSSSSNNNNNSSQKMMKSAENSQKPDIRAIYSNMQNLMSLAENLQTMPSGTRKSQPSSGSGSSASDSSDSEDAPDKLPSAIGGRATGSQHKLPPDGHVAELLSTPKYSRGEKKARRLLMKLDLQPVANVSRVTMRKAKNVLLCIDQPEVFKCPHTKTIICFGEVRIENTSNAAAAQAAERYINDVNVRAPALSKDRDQLVADNADEEEEIDVAALASELDEKDIELVQMQAGCTRQTAIKALIKHKSDVVNAIMELTVGVDI